MTNLVNPGKPNNLSPKDAWPSTFNSNDSGEASKLVEIEPAKPSRFAQQLANDMQSEKTPNRSGPSASPTNTPKKYDRVSQKNDDGQFISRHEKFAGLENQAAPKEFLRASPKDRPTKAADGKSDLDLQTRVIEDKNPNPTAKKSSKSNPGSPVPTNSLSNSNEDQALDSKLNDLDPKPSDKSSPQTGLMKKDTDQSLGDSSPKQTSDWGQRLKNALASMGGMGSFLQQNPALALLSGHLEAIEPAQIPVIISASPLIQQLLAAPQSLDVLQSPISMNQGLQVLGLNQTSISPEQAGPTTNLQELLKTLGFDESRICKEGDLLRDNLSLGDIGPYMKRAEILRAELGLLPMAVQTKSPLLPNLTKDQSPNPAAALQDIRATKPQRSPLLADLLNSPPTEQVFLVPLDATVINNNFPEAFSSKGKDHLRGESDAVIGAKAQASPDLSMPTLFTATDPLQAPNPNPLSRLTGVDPFLSMAGRWDQATVHTLLMDSSQNLSESTNKNPEQLLAPMRSLDEILSRQFIQGPDSNSQNLQLIPPKMDSLSIDANSLFIINESRGTQDNQSEFSGQGQDQSNNQDPSQSQFYAALPNSGINSKFNVQSTSNAADTSKVPPHISQSVFDKSSMLIKDGGGSLRIDLGSRDNGPLDLAVNINGNNVDIRIITHSQQARDALMQDLPRLRDSLLNHHLNLDKVEIGISNNSTWSQSSGDGRQSRQQQFENIKESELRGLTGIRATRSSYRSSAQSISNDINPLHNGLIQVRV